jgi:tetratricopeptide (TPR) repeat protein
MDSVSPKGLTGICPGDTVRVRSDFHLRRMYSSLGKMVRGYIKNTILSLGIVLVLAQSYGYFPSPQEPRETLSPQQTAERLMDLMDYPMAGRYYRYLIEQHPGQIGLRVQLAFAMIQIGELDEAKAQLLEESRLFPRELESQALLSHVLFKEDDLEEARNACLRYGDLVESELRRAGLDKASVPAERQTLRERIIRSWQRTHPNLGLPYYILGHCLKRSGHPEQATAGFLSAAEMGYDPLSCRVQLIDIDLEAQRWQDALDRIHETTLPLRERPEFAFLEGHAFYGIGNGEEAVRSIRKACDLRPYWVEALTALARLQFTQKESAEAAELLERAKALAPNDRGPAKGHEGPALTRTFIENLKPAWRYVFHNDKAYIIPEIDARFLSGLRQGSLDEAVDFLRRFLALYDEDGNLNFKLATLLNEREKYEESLKYAFRAIELDRDYKNAHDLAGDVLFAIGDYVHSVEAYQNVIRIAPDDAMAHYNLGCAHNALGETTQAEVHWRKVLQLDTRAPRMGDEVEKPGDPLQYSLVVHVRPPAFHARLALGRLYIRKGLTHQALEELGQASVLVPSEPDTYFELAHAFIMLGDREKAAANLRKYISLGGKKESEARVLLETLPPR